jgi:hypothetical protein
MVKPTKWQEPFCYEGQNVSGGGKSSIWRIEKVIHTYLLKGSIIHIVSA